MAPTRRAKPDPGRAAIELVEGETLQIQAAHEGVLDRDIYYQIISKKTAAPFVACTELAQPSPARRANGSPRSASTLNLGLAFQVIDDVLDLSGDAQPWARTLGLTSRRGAALLLCATVERMPLHRGVGHAGYGPARNPARAIATDCHRDRPPKPASCRACPGQPGNLAADSGPRRATGARQASHPRPSAPQPLPAAQMPAARLFERRVRASWRVDADGSGTPSRRR